MSNPFTFQPPTLPTHTQPLRCTCSPRYSRGLCRQPLSSNPYQSSDQNGAPVVLALVPLNCTQVCLSHSYYHSGTCCRARTLRHLQLTAPLMSLGFSPFTSFLLTFFGSNALIPSDVFFVFFPCRDLIPSCPVAEFVFVLLMPCTCSFVSEKENWIINKVP